MIYVISDLHGCYEQYKQMLEKIQFSNNDTLYILGDVIDRGNDGIKILQDMQKRKNIVPLIGNHEYMAYKVLNKLNVEITIQNYDTQFDRQTLEMYENWMYNGGIPTIQQFLKLDKTDREKIIKYLGTFDLYEELDVGGNKFVLVHGGLMNFDENKDLDEYDIYDIIWDRCDYTKQYYRDKYLVTGHTPTYHINPNYKGRIFKKNNHIAIDCGVTQGGRLGCICLNTFEEFYIGGTEK